MTIIVGIACVLAILIFIFEMLRRGKIREKYAVLWIVIGLGILVLVAFPDILVWTSQLLGVQIPSNLLFSLALVLLVGVCLHLSFEQSQSEDEIRALAEEVGILKTELEAIRADLKKVDGTEKAPQENL